MSKYCVIGCGLIGTALKNRLGEVSYFPTPSTETVFYVDGPTHVDFELNPDYHIQKGFDDLTRLLPYCKRYNIRLVYASSALVYEKDTQFTKWKRAMELLVMAYQHTLVLRIFPVYGGSETKTVISQWIKEMKQDKQPKVFGDGTQKRDFINIEDVVEQICLMESARVGGIANIGTGNPTSFNDIVSIINKELGKNLEPIYVEKPKDYSDGIQCIDPLPSKIDMTNGIRKIILEQ